MSGDAPLMNRMIVLRNCGIALRHLVHGDWCVSHYYAR